MAGVISFRRQRAAHRRRIGNFFIGCKVFRFMMQILMLIPFFIIISFNGMQTILKDERQQILEYESS